MPFSSLPSPFAGARPALTREAMTVHSKASEIRRRIPGPTSRVQAGLRNARLFSLIHQICLVQPQGLQFQVVH